MLARINHQTAVYEKAQELLEFKFPNGTPAMGEILSAEDRDERGGSIVCNE
jgi:hypothetical protein